MFKMLNNKSKNKFNQKTFLQKIILVTNIISIFLLLVVGFKFYRMVELAKLDNPQLVITKGVLKSDTKPDYVEILGKYDYGNNIIVVSTQYSNRVANTIYHEYAHWVEYTKFTDYEHKKWSIICNKSLEQLNVSYDYYTEEEQCKERFARSMATYQTYGIVFDSSLSESNFIKMMYNKYY